MKQREREREMKQKVCKNEKKNHEERLCKMKVLKVHTKS